MKLARSATSTREFVLHWYFACVGGAWLPSASSTDTVVAV